MKYDKQKEAKRLRNEGKSVTWIAKELSVSKGSVSVWVKEIQLSDEQQQKLLNSQTNNFKNEYNSAKQKQCQIQRKNNQEVGKNKAKEKDMLHCMGCMLFWAEGNKDKNKISFTNSDVNMLKLFVKFLKQTLNIQNNQISILINCFLNKSENINDTTFYWIKELDLDGARINKPTIKITDETINNYGVCRLTVFNTELVQQLYGAIQEYGGFNNDMCLENKRSRM